MKKTISIQLDEADINHDAAHHTRNAVVAATLRKLADEVEADADPIDGASVRIARSATTGELGLRVSTQGPAGDGKGRLPEFLN